MLLLYSPKIIDCFYNILKPLVRLAMLIFCRRIIINKPGLLKRKDLCYSPAIIPILSWMPL